RALEIFGDEKFLDQRVRDNALFGGRLPLSTLGTFCVPLPLPARTAEAPGRPLLVVENHHSYWSFGQWNVTARRYAAVVYGSGRAFASSGRALRQVVEQTQASHAEYFGDIDPVGVA